MTPRRKPCTSCGQEFGFHSTTCSVFPSPNRPQSESEKFFAQNDIKLVAYSQEMPFRESGFRVVITPKETT